MRVLVVEDEVRLAATLQDLLELNGYTVDVCHDGEAAGWLCTSKCIFR